MQHPVDTVAGYFSDDAEPELGSIAALLSGSHPADGARQTLDIVRAIRVSKPTVTAIADVSERLASISVVSSRDVQALIYVQESGDGLVDGIRLATSVPEIASPGDLGDALERIADRTAVLHREGDDAELLGREPMAVSSLAKLFVLEATLVAANEGALNLSDEHTIEEADLAFLSSGLTRNHVGSSVSLLELCSMLITRSDNTASDILIDVVGRERVLDRMTAHGVPRDLNSPLRTTREYFFEAWGPDLDRGADHGVNDAILRERSLTTPAFQNGHDYFATLASVDSVMQSLSSMPWSPWKQVSAAQALQFKGGSAPGVLAGAWHRPWANGPTGIAFALNTSVPLGAIEELYAFSCAEALLRSTGAFDNSQLTL